jgi:hypothetical protein
MKMVASLLIWILESWKRYKMFFCGRIGHETKICRKRSRNKKYNQGPFSQDQFGKKHANVVEHVD